MKKKLAIAAAVPLVLTALIGVLHLPFARPLLALIGVGCPAKATPEAVEAARLASAKASRGEQPSPARPALGFALDRTRRAEVDAWVAKNALTCAETQRGTVLRCTGVPSALVGQEGAAIDELAFLFEPKALRLRTVTLLRNQLDAGGAATAMNSVTTALATQLGQGRKVGDATPLWLAAAPMHTALVEYRFSDYIANVSATNLGARVAVREHYMSAVD